ncbi:MAG: hypothetical protein ABIE22_00940 [archaeon]
MKEVKIVFSNKALYTLLALLFLISGALVVYAFGGSQPNVMGHTGGEITVTDPTTSNDADLDTTLGNILTVAESSGETIVVGYTHCGGAGIYGLTSCPGSHPNEVYRTASFMVSEDSCGGQRQMVLITCSY